MLISGLVCNQIEFIHKTTFNETVMNFLNLAGNPISSFETISFLYSISSTLVTLSFSNCMNFFKINWFIIEKLEILYNLNLSGINKTDQFWFYQQTDDNNDSFVYWNYPAGLSIILHDMQFTDNDYCLSKSISHILNQTTLIIDINHPCNYFLFKLNNSFDSEQRPICLLNNSIIEKLTTQCENIDLFCESFLKSTTSIPPLSTIDKTEQSSPSSIIRLNITTVVPKFSCKNQIVTNRRESF